MLKTIKLILPLFLLFFAATMPAYSAQDPFNIKETENNRDAQTLEITHEAQKLRDKKIKKTSVIAKNKKAKLIKILNRHEEDVMNFIQQSRSRDASKGLRLKQTTNEIKIANAKKAKGIKELLGGNGYNKFLGFERQMKKEINIELTPKFGKGALRGTVYETRKRPKRK